jgi:photosystem II stability/assembly factor-like uncharacterized protein
MKIHLLFIISVGITLQCFSQKKNKKTQQASPIITQSTASAAADRLVAFKKRQILNETSLAKNIKYRNVGPTVMSGRVADIDVNDENPTEFYVGYATGGLWHTTNNGQSFEPLFDNEAVMTIGDVAVDWKAKNKTIWLGTGESISSRSSYAGIGVYKSDDSGKTWQHKGLEETHHIGEIKIHPTDPNTVWVAALGHLYTSNKDRGIFKTSDGGTTWKNTLYVDENTGAIDLQTDPTNPKILYACMWQKARKAWNFEESGLGTGIYKSIDGGDNWESITNKASGFPQGATNGRVGIAISPQNTNLLYAVLDNQAIQIDYLKKEITVLDSKKLKLLTKDQFLELPNIELNSYLDENGFPEKYSAKSLKADVKSDKIKVEDIGKFTDNADNDLYDTPIKGAEVYRSENGGKTWTRTHKGYLEAVFNTYGYVFGTVHISPNNTEKIVIPGFQLILSEDGGKTFTSMNAPNVHADHHVIWMNPKNDKHMILGNDGGLNITYDNGKTWFFANSPALGMFYSVQVDMAKPYNVYGGLQDNGVWVGPSTYKANNEWHSDGHYPYKSIMGGDGMQVAVDTRDNNTIYTGYQFGNYYRIDKKTEQSKYLKMPQDIGEMKNRFNWQSPIMLSKHNQDIVYFGGNKLFRSMDKGEKFTAISQDLTKGSKKGDVPFGTLTTMDESALKFGLLYMGTDDGNIHVSKDGGYNFTLITNNLPQNLWVSRIVASNHIESRVYASLNGYRNDDFNHYLFRSDNYGETWTKLGENLPNEAINVVREDPKNANLLYVGTDHGLYTSIDQGKSFMGLSTGIPSIPIHDLVIHPRDNEIVAGTHGRSIYIADVQHLQQLTDSLTSKSLHLFGLKTINYNNYWGKFGWSGKYEKIKKQEYSIPYYSKTASKINFKIKRGTYVLKQWEGKADAGLNYENWDLTIDSLAKFDYQIQLNGARKNTEPKIVLEASDDGNFYIKPGKYILTIEKENGDKIDKEIEVKAIEKLSKREG